jgi:hypothetical protein
MLLPYIQYIVGDEKETPIALLPKQKRKILLNVPAEYIRKIS